MRSCQAPTAYGAGTINKNARIIPVACRPHNPPMTCGPGAVSARVWGTESWHARCVEVGPTPLGVCGLLTNDHDHREGTNICSLTRTSPPIGQDERELNGLIATPET